MYPLEEESFDELQHAMSRFLLKVNSRTDYILSMYMNIYLYIYSFIYVFFIFYFFTYIYIAGMYPLEKGNCDELQHAMSRFLLKTNSCIYIVYVYVYIYVLTYYFFIFIFSPAYTRWRKETLTNYSMQCPGCFSR